MSVDLANYTDVSLLLLRLMVALVFGTSGWSDFSNPAARSKSIGMSQGFAIFLGLAELLGALAVALGLFTQWAAIGLILVMLGAIYKKAFEWKTGFWGKGSHGWHYDLLFIAMNLVIMTTGGGRFVLWK